MDIMRYLKEKIFTCNQLSEYQRHLFWSAFTLCFFGFLRVGKITTSVDESQFHTLLFSNISTANGFLHVRIATSKTDQFGHGYHLRLPATQRSVCPFRAMQKYCNLRNGTAASHSKFLYVCENGTPLSRSLFAAVLKLLLKNLHNASRYSPHSFRIGAASTAASNDTAPADIQRAGRWRSSCFTKYIRSEVPLTGIRFYPLEHSE
jgi:hypothetical protein